MAVVALWQTKLFCRHGYFLLACKSLTSFFGEPFGMVRQNLFILCAVSELRKSVVRFQGTACASGVNLNLLQRGVAKHSLNLARRCTPFIQAPPESLSQPMRRALWKPCGVAPVGHLIAQAVRFEGAPIFRPQEYHSFGRGRERVQHLLQFWEDPDIDLYRLIVEWLLAAIRNPAVLNVLPAQLDRIDTGRACVKHQRHGGVLNRSGWIDLFVSCDLALIQGVD